MLSTASDEAIQPWFGSGFDVMVSLGSRQTWMLDLLLSHLSFRAVLHCQQGKLTHVILDAHSAG